eukprot:3142030-Rhodomonas_salina.2
MPSTTPAFHAWDLHTGPTSHPCTTTPALAAWCCGHARHGIPFGDDVRRGATAAKRTRGSLPMLFERDRPEELALSLWAPRDEGIAA